MMAKGETVAGDIAGAKMSCVRSWHWNRADFDAQWRRLCECGSIETAGETIWQTRFKEVQLLTVPSDDGGYRVAFKNYHEKRFFRYFLRPSLATREAHGFAVVARLGIPVAEVLAFGENRRFLNLVDAYFVTKFEEGTKTMDDFLAHPEEHDKLLALLRDNIIRLAQLHAAGYIHGGAHPRNILWKESPGGGLESIWIDLATVRRISTRRPNWKYVLTDLADLTEKFKLTQEELDRLAAEYRNNGGFPIAYRVRTDHYRKFSSAIRSE